MRDLNGLISRHHELESILKNATTKEFISDWNCDHTFYKNNFTTGIHINEVQQYKYVREDNELAQMISGFHEKSDHHKYLLNEILVSNGSATIISAFFIWLKMEKVAYVYYVPPLYYTFHFFSKIYDIPLRPVTRSQLLEEEVSLNLPDKKCVLILTDPIWYAGFSIGEKYLSRIKSWQNSTKSLIFIDGSFQYFKWNLSKQESSAGFNKDHTLRLVCPSKVIATHGFRFSYLLTPTSYYSPMSIILDNLLGSSSIYDVQCAKQCMKIMSSKDSNNNLIKYTANIYEALIDNSIIETEIVPDCGYFIFARLISGSKSHFVSMDGKYFEQDRFKDHLRINLLSSAVRRLIDIESIRP